MAVPSGRDRSTYKVTGVQMIVADFTGSNGLEYEVVESDRDVDADDSVADQPRIPTLNSLVRQTIKCLNDPESAHRHAKDAARLQRVYLALSMGLVMLDDTSAVYEAFQSPVLEDLVAEVEMSMSNFVSAWRPAAEQKAVAAARSSVDDLAQLEPHSVVDHVSVEAHLRHE